MEDLIERGKNKGSEFQLAYVTSIVRNPCKHCLFHWFVLLSLTATVFFGGFFELSALSINDFIVIEDRDVQDFFVASRIDDQADERVNNSPRIFRKREVPLFEHGALFIYELDNEDSSFFTPVNVQFMCEVESLFLKQEEYEFFCLTQNAQGLDSRCSSQALSFSFIFYGNELECDLLNQSAIDLTLDNLLTQQEDLLFDDVLNPTLIRSILVVAGPLGEDSPPFQDFERPQRSVKNQQATNGYARLINSYSADLLDFFGLTERVVFSPFSRRTFQKSETTINVRVGGPLIEDIELTKVLRVDQILSSGSFLVVMLLVAFYIKSCILSCLSMVSILLSLTSALFLFAVVFRINYFTPLNIIVLFLIAGIGADNVLVLVDAWRQSEYEIKRDVGLHVVDGEYVRVNSEEQFTINRLNYAFSRAAVAVSNTAITTFIAFMATAISPIPAIAGLGVYASLVILTNWWFMFTVHPTNLMWHYFSFVKFFHSKQEAKETVQEDNTKSKAFGLASLVFANIEGGVHDAAINTRKVYRESLIMPGMSPRTNLQKMSSLKTPRKVSGMPNLNDISGLNLNPTLSLEPERKLSNVELEASSLPSSSSRFSNVNQSVLGSYNMARERDTYKTAYSGTRRSTLNSIKPPKLDLLRVVYGDEAEEKMGCFKKLISGYAYLVNHTLCRYISLSLTSLLTLLLFLSFLQLETPDVLLTLFPEDHMFGTFLLDFQNSFASTDPASFARVEIVFGSDGFDISGIKKLTSDKEGGTVLFNDNFELFFEQNQTFINDICDELSTLECNEDGCLQDTLLFNADLRCPLTRFEEFVAETTDFNASFVDEEIGIPDKDTFLQIATDFRNAGNNDIGFVDGVPAFIALNFRLSLRKNTGLANKGPVLDFLDDFVNSKRVLDDGLAQTALAGSEEHVFVVSEKALLTGLYEGLAISLSASFVVLLIGTQSLRIASIAIFAVGSVAINVLGMVQVQGGTLGTAESIAGVFVIGLSVDYIVHLGHMFKHSTSFIIGEERDVVEGDDEKWWKFWQNKSPMVYYTKDMLDFTIKKMGGTVLAGALTTFCSALFLSLCTFDFFGKMSNLLLLTILFAIIQAFFFFIPALRVFGPGKK